jgi:PKD domain
MRRIALGVTAALFLTEALTFRPAAADELGGNVDGCGAFGSLGSSVGAAVSCPGSPTQTTSTQEKDSTSHTTLSGDTWKPVDNDFGYITCPNPTGPNLAYSLQEYGPNGKPIGNPTVVCPQPAPKPAAPPPPPPTPAEVWASVPLPTPAMGINPAAVGITQLPSWFWVTGANGPVTVTVIIDGYTVTTTATPVAYQWNFGDGSSSTGVGPGDETNPSVTHTYHYKGTYIVTLSIEYAGTFSYAGFGSIGTEALGDYEQPGLSAPYVVQEVRSVLTPTEGS